jgi:hypothetical protein
LAEVDQKLAKLTAVRDTLRAALDAGCDDLLAPSARVAPTQGPADARGLLRLLAQGSYLVSLYLFIASSRRCNASPY